MFLEIRNRVVEIIKNLGMGKIYSHEIKEGFDRPCFFVGLTPIKVEYLNKNYKKIKILIVINYFSENKTESENLEMMDILEKNLGMILEVEDRKLVINDLRSQTIDGNILETKFNLEFLVNMPRIELEEEMGSLGIDLSGEIV